MKRSEINGIISQTKVFLEEQNFAMPPFAAWGVDDWREKGEEVREIVERRLGWDVTDHGSGAFLTSGLVLFTLRNGSPEGFQSGQGKTYAEKIMIVEPGQSSLLHMHLVKMEDIINRGGGRIAFELYRATEDHELSEADVEVSLDGVRRMVPSGEVIELGRGESITLAPKVFHRFWGVNERVLLGEVSSVNDDVGDNVFYDPSQKKRYPAIEEDQQPLHLLCTEYERYWGKK